VFRARRDSFVNKVLQAGSGTR